MTERMAHYPVVELELMVTFLVLMVVLCVRVPLGCKAVRAAYNNGTLVYIHPLTHYNHH